MRLIAYIDPGTTGLIAQFAAAGFAGVVLYFRSKFRRNKQATEESATPSVEDSADERA